jgi:hypothetical protein
MFNPWLSYGGGGVVKPILARNMHQMTVLSPHSRLCCSKNDQIYGFMSDVFVCLFFCRSNIDKEKNLSIKWWSIIAQNGVDTFKMEHVKKMVKRCFYESFVDI